MLSYNSVKMDQKRVPNRFIPARSCDFTRYPKIFERSYWGRYTQELEIEREQVIRVGLNRNKFVEMYNIKSIRCKVARKKETEFEVIINGHDVRDHIEYYMTKDKQTVSLFSTDCIDDNKHKILLDKGYLLFDPLYTMSDKTYIKII
jgi:hypothetical protein